MKHAQRLTMIVALALAAPTIARCDDFYRKQGEKSYAAKDYRQAVSYYTKAIEQDGNDHQSYFWRGEAYDKLREYRKVSGDLSRAVALQPSSAYYLNGFAWFLATNPSTLDRDGKRALEIATKACELTDFKNAYYVDTLAAAHAEVGNFASARRYQLDAWKLCEEKDKEDFYSRLVLFRANKPYRQGVVPAGAVYFANQSDQTVTIACRHFVDQSGKTQRPDASWTLKPGQGGYLQIDGKRVVAQSFNYTVSSSGGSSDWKSLTSDFDADGDLYLPFTSKDLLLASRATRPGTTTERSYRTPSSSPDSEAVQRAIAKILGATVANEFAKDQDQKEGLFAALLSVGARAGRDKLVESALKDVFPELSDVEIRGIRRVAGLYLDGELSLGNLGKETAKEEIISALKEEDPRLGTSAQVVDFLYELHKARSNQKLRN